jgi:hypothetical protein
LAEDVDAAVDLGARREVADENDEIAGGGIKKPERERRPLAAPGSFE